MDEVCLSKENVGRLRDLGFKNVAAVVLLPSVRLEAATVAPCDVSILAETTIVRAVENFPKVSSNETRLDMLLQIFACLVLQPAIARCSSEGADIDVHDTESIPLDMGQPDSLNSSMNSSDLLLYDSLTQTLALQILWNRGTLAVTAYADPGDLWTTETAARLAQRILSLQLSGQGLTNFIIGPVLNQHVRLILSSPTGGDPSANSRASGSVAALDLAEYENAAAVLNWAIRMTESPDIGKYWHRFVPALVNLAESREMSVREGGLKAIISFLAKCPSSAIYTTGMDQLFERTILPTLLLLPTATPEKDSVTLLRLGYTAALQLATTSGDSHNANRRRILDMIIRDGILEGFRHAADYISVVDVLMQYVAEVVSCLGIFSIKHLKVSLTIFSTICNASDYEDFLQDLLDVIESVICDPFGADHPGVLTSAAEALIVIMTNCWPRISNTKRVEQILRILGVCWLNMNNEASQSIHEGSMPVLKSRILQAAGLVRFFAQTNASEINRTSRAAVLRDRRLQDILMQ
ncbi:hypothetical protein MAA_02703 [Metarhizium robertsii ARSEF 23]|uniref:Uncharacterized protein n=1 Tax=Metarhizium robertsii (strain ARSEF 23 / ATCC MYA-3075) TaxID=655844 RepID=E9ERV7_METRA|nr:uncharacterized protein MAA_02703 [Metarhizium robertsii ARSEF 23]EFZ01474.2 hypothetical protein MAA_02703 [Metarhizium robertsii ARSEF 23]